MTFDEWSAKKRKQSNTNTVSFDEWSAAKSVDSDYINSFIKDYNSFFGSVEKEYSGLSWQNASSAYDGKKSAYDDLVSRAGKLKNYVKVNKKKMDEKSYQDFSSILSQLETSGKSVMDAYGSVKDFYAQFKTEDEYNSWQAASKHNAMIDEINAMDAAAIQEKIDNITKGKAEVDQIKEDIKKYELIRDNYFKLAKANGVSASEADKNAKLAKEQGQAEIDRLNKRLASYGNVSDIAYTTLDGKNVTWQSLYDKKVFEENFSKQLADAKANPNYAKLVEEANGMTGNLDKYGKLTMGQNRVATLIRWGDKMTEIAAMAGASPKNSLLQEASLVKQMKQEEADLYSYLLLYAGEKEANKYYNNLKPLLEERSLGATLKQWQGFADDFPVLSSVVSVGTNLASGLEYISDLFTGDQYSTSSAITSTIRGTVSEKVNWNLGDWDAFDFIYNTGMSAADSFVAGTAFGPTGAGVTLGLSAAASGTNNALERGLTKEQAFWNGLSSGIFEGLFETVSLGQFSALKQSFAFGGKEIAKNIAKSMLVNASEEMATEAANIVYDIIANGDFSHYETTVRMYMAQGMSEEDAKWNAALDLGAQIAESGASGALMGFGFGAIGNLHGYRNAIQNAKENYSNIEKDLVNEALAIDPNYAFAKKMQTILDQGKSLSGVQIQQLINHNESGKSKIHEPDNTDVHQTSNIATDEYSEDIDDSVTDEETANPVTETADLPEADVKTDSESNSPTVAEEAAEGKFSASDDGRTYNYKTGEDVSVKGVASVKNGKVMLALADGSKVNAEDIRFANEETAMLYDMLSSIGDISDKMANVLIKSYDPSDGVSIGIFTRETALGFMYGTIGYRKGLDNLDLTPLQKERAFLFGQDYAKQTGRDYTNTSRKAGDVTKEKPSEDGLYYDGVKPNDESLTVLQKASLEGLRTVAKMSRLEIHVFASYEENGKRYSLVNGVKRLAPNGYFRDGNRIYIDLYSGNNAEGVMLYTLSHEVTHYIAENSFEDFKALGKFLFEQYEAKNVNIDALIQREINRLRVSYERDGKAIPGERKLYMEAYEEVVANAMSKMFADPKAYEKLAALKSQNHSLWQKLGKAIKKMLDRLKKILGSYSHRSASNDAANAVDRFSKEVYDKLQDLYIKAFIKADANFSAKESGSADGDVSYSVREIVGESGKEYGIGVYLDSTLLDNLTDEERIDMVKERVKELGGNSFVAYDKAGNPVSIRIADNKEKYRNPKGNKVRANRHLFNYVNNKTKQEAISLADEVILVARFDTDEPAIHKHDWLDNDGKNNWDIWKTYLQDKENTVWEATLRVANSKNGEKVLYEIYPIEKVETGTKDATITTDISISQNTPVVNTKSDTTFSERDSDYMDAVTRGDMETAQKMVDEAAKAAGYTVRGMHATNAEFTVFDISKTSDINYHGKGIYFTNSQRDVENNYENYEGPDPWQKIEGEAYELLYDKYGLSYEDTLTSDSEIIEKLDECYDEVIEKFKRTLRRITAYLKFDNPLIIGKGENVKDYDLSKYDGIIDSHVYENIGHVGMDENTIHYVVLNPSNIKSADPVTYDDNGQVIPLSERFNSEDSDIRYSERETDGQGIDLNIKSKYNEDTRTTNNTDGGNHETVNQGTETGISESESGTRGKDENRSSVQSERGEERSGLPETRQTPDGLHSGRQEVKHPKDFIERDFVHPKKGSILHTLQSKALEEYDLKCHIVKESSWGRDSEAFIYQNEIYAVETISEDSLKDVIPHEGTHAMNLTKFKPYLAFLERTPEMVEFSSYGAQRLVKDVQDHLRKKKPDFDFLTMSESEHGVFYDELNAYVYGLTKGGALEDSNYDYGKWLPGAFNDFDAYINELTSIHDQFKAGRKVKLQDHSVASYSERDYEYEEQRIKVEKVLAKENQKLREDNQYLKELLKLQHKETHGTIFTKSSVDIVAGKLKHYANTYGNKAELTKLLHAFYTFIASSEQLDWSDVVEKAKPAVNWLMEHESQNNKKSEDARETLRTIRAARIYLDEAQKAEAAHRYGSFREYRNKAMGSLTLVTQGNPNGSISLDSQWQEWAELYPEYFDANTNPNDMPVKLMEIVDSIRNADISSTEYEYSAMMLEQDLISKVYDSYWDVSTLHTVTDSMQKLKVKHRLNMQALRDYHNEKHEQLVKDYKERINNIITQGRESREKSILKRKLKRVIGDLDKLLVNGTKKKNIKQSERDVVASSMALANILFDSNISNEDIVRLGVESVTEKESKALNRYRDLLDEIDSLKGKMDAIHGNANVKETLVQDIDALQKEIDKIKRDLYALNRELADVFERERARLNKTTMDTIMTDLINEYAALEKNQDSYVANAFSEMMKSRLEVLKETLSGTVVRDMDIYQLQETYDMFSAIAQMVRESNKLFIDGKKADLNEIIESARKEILAITKERKDRWAPVGKVMNAIDRFSWENLRPTDAAERLGSRSIEKLIDALLEAQITAATYIEEGQEVITDTRRKYGFSEWNLKSADKEYTTKDGLKFKPTLGEKMAIYAYSKRAQADGHIEDGGFVFDTGRTYKDEENGRTYEYRRLSDAYRFTPDQVKAITNSLTKEQRDYVDAILPYFNKLGERGNDVSMTLYGIKIFGETIYFPLMSSRDYMNSTKVEVGKTKTMSSLANSGFTKQTVPGANNPIVLKSFDDVVIDHIADMANYNALVIPIENFRRVFDSVNRDPVAEGDDGKGQVSSIKALIKNRYGAAAEEYFNQLLTDINGGISPQGAQNPFAKAFGRAKKTQVLANLSVVAQQYFSIYRAMELIDAKYFAPFLSKEAKKSDVGQYEELRKYAPVAILKEIGGFDVGSSGRVQEYIKYEEARMSGKKVLKKIDDAASWGAEMMDKLGWTTIWKAVKAEVAAERKFKPGTEEFLKACGKRFTQVINKTQVYDSVMTRSGYMRSKNDAVKYATSFMGEPTVIAGRAYMAILRFVRAKDGEKKYAALRMGRTFGALALSSVLGKMAVALVYAGRDDEDEDKAFLERWANQFGSALAEDLKWYSPLNYVPFGRDVVTTIQGFTVERPDMALFEDIVNAFKKMGDGDVTLDDSLNFIGSIGNFTGVPLKNVIREIKSAINVIGDLTDGVEPTDIGSAFESGLFEENVSKEERLYNAIVGGDSGKIEAIKKTYKKPEDYTKAVRNALANHDSRIRDAVVEYYNGNIGVKESTANEIVAEGHFSEKDVKLVLNNEIRQAETQAEAAKTAKAEGDTEAYKKKVKALLDKYPKAFVEKMIDEAIPDIEDGESEDEAVSYYTSQDVNFALNSGDVVSAKKAIEDIINTKMANGKTKKEAQASVRSSMTSYWKKIYKDAYARKDYDETARIRKLLHETGVYGSVNDLNDTCRNWLREKDED